MNHKQLLTDYTLFLKRYQGQKQELTISDKIIIEQFLTLNNNNGDKTT